MALSPLVLALLLQAAPTPAQADSVPARPATAAADSVVATLASNFAPSPADSQVDARLMPHWDALAVADTQPRRPRPRAVAYSDWYYRRLTIHRWGSYVEFPLFAAEYYLGNKLISRTDVPPTWVRPTHIAVAGGLGALFTLNTVTGVWNLYDSRHNTPDRAVVWTHSALMLAADAGFAITGARSGAAHRTTAGKDPHKNAALVSIGLATVGTAVMWVARGIGG